MFNIRTVPEKDTDPCIWIIIFNYDPLCMLFPNKTPSKVDTSYYKFIYSDKLYRVMNYNNFKLSKWNSDLHDSRRQASIDEFEFMLNAYEEQNLKHIDESSLINRIKRDYLLEELLK